MGTNTHTILYDAIGEYGGRASADLTGFSTLRDTTFGFKFYLDDLQDSMTIASIWGSTASSRKFLVYLNANGALYFGFRTSGNYFAYTDASTFTTGQWYDISAYITTTVGVASGCKIAVDGTDVDVTYGINTTGTVNNGGYPLYSGYRANDSVGQFYGKLDELRIYSGDYFTFDKTNRGDQIDPASTGLIAYYRFNNDGTDETSNGNDLTITNATFQSASLPFVGTYPGGATTVVQDLLGGIIPFNR